MSTFITPIKPIDFLGADTEKTNPISSSSFDDLYQQLLNQTQQASEVSKADGVDLAYGDVDDLAKIQIDSMKSQAMLQTTVQLTSRMVNAYKEIMQMQI